jgi:hypothetical protein
MKFVRAGEEAELFFAAAVAGRVEIPADKEV